MLSLNLCNLCNLRIQFDHKKRIDWSDAEPYYHWEVRMLKTVRGDTMSAVMKTQPKMAVMKPQTSLFPDDTEAKWSAVLSKDHSIRWPICVRR